MLAFGLAMDAFTVSMTNGMCYRGTSVKKLGFACGAAFGFFQGIMPLLGYLIGSAFSKLIEQYDHWIAFLLLGIIGGRMIYEAIKKKDDSPDCCPRFSSRTLTVQAVATSIDAMAVGVSFAVMGVNILTSSALIALITFFCCFVGVAAGRRFGGRLKSKAEMLGGGVLVLIGLKIFIEHTAHGI